MGTGTEQNINQAIDWLQKTGTAVQNFTLEQAPIYCREVVAWEFWSNLIYSIFAVIALATVFSIVRLALNSFVKEKHLTVSGIIGIIISIILTIVSVISLFNCVPQMIKAKVAPRMIVIEHFRGLNKPNPNYR
jgi:uncharacterized membrane protein YcjF (UPF0283 family)